MLSASSALGLNSALGWPNTKCSYWVMLVVGIFFGLVLVDGSILTLQVEPKGRECFYEDVSEPSAYSLEFEVIRGGLLDIKLSVTDPTNRVLVEKMAFFNKQDDQQNEQEGQVTFSTNMGGTHQICFDNSMSRWTAKVVSFRMSTSKKDELVKFEHLTPMVDSVIKISEELNSIETLQHHMRVREQSHRDASETINSRVQYLALFESAMLITISLIQVQLISKWFADSDKRIRV